MKILVIDQDSVSSRLIRDGLELRGHSVVEEAVREAALKRLEEDGFEMVFCDPASLAGGPAGTRPLVLSIRRAAKCYPYLVLTSHDLLRDDAISWGANDALTKPLDKTSLRAIMTNCDRLIMLLKRLSDESEDFPNGGGVIAKSAFNQLFLSAIDRAERYCEQSFLLFIGIRNHKNLTERYGGYTVAFAAARLSQYLVRLRRQSDIIAQTGASEYCLMLQRPRVETEPAEAAKRFAAALAKIEDIAVHDGDGVEVGVSLVSLPTGQLHAEHVVSLEKNGRRGSG